MLIASLARLFGRKAKADTIAIAVLQTAKHLIAEQRWCRDDLNGHLHAMCALKKAAEIRHASQDQWIAAHYELLHAAGRNGWVRVETESYIVDRGRVLDSFDSAIESIKTKALQ